MGDERILECASVATEEAIGAHFDIEAIPMLQGNQGTVSAQLILVNY